VNRQILLKPVFESYYTDGAYDEFAGGCLEKHSTFGYLPDEVA